MSSTLVVLQANNLQQLNFLYQGNARLKVMCFDLSPSHILLGANSGTIYVLDHETLHLKNQIPAGNGCVTQLLISSDEQQVACALSNGTVMVFELQPSSAQLLTSSMEHQGHAVTSLVWAQSQPELYIGDASGRVSMLHVSKSKTASLFRSSCLHLMTLESSITQLDYREGYLLVSTLTRSYVCNTSLETFSQVGTKLRQGEYGGCFCQVNPSGTSMPFKEAKGGVEDLQALFTTSDKFGLSECYEAVEEEQPYHPPLLGRERPGKPILPMLTSHVFCARPGTRIWEADHSGRVLVTHQLKSALMVSPAEILLADGSYREQDLIQEINDLPSVTDDTGIKLPDCETNRESDSLKTTHPPVSVSFTKMLSFYNKYLLAISAYGLYIIDPATSKVLVWVNVSDGISDIKVSGNTLIYKSGNGCIQNLMITTVDIAILILHTRKLYTECASLCLKNQDAFAKSEFLSRLGVNILKDLKNNIASSLIKEKIRELKSFVDVSKRKNQSQNITKISGVTYVKNKSFEAEEIKANLNVALKKHPVLSGTAVTRWNSEPHLSRNQVEWEKAPAAQGTVSMKSSPVRQVRKNEGNENSLDRVHEAPNHTSGEDALQFKSSERSMTSQGSVSQRCSDSSGADHGLGGSNSLSSNPSYSQQSDPFSPQKSLESSLDMFEDPLFTPEESPSPDPEAASRILLDSHPQAAPSYASHNFYNLAYAPIHPGSEAATLLQDLMESVTTNVVDTFTSGTKTITERLKSVAPLVTPWGDTEGGVPVSEVARNHCSPDLKDPPTSLKDSDSGGDFNSAIVIQSKSKKKQPKRQFSLLATKGKSQAGLEETVPQPELPGVVRNLHELVCATLQQMTITVDPEGTQKLLCHWFEMFCCTVQQIQCNSKHSLPLGSEEQAGEGPVSLSSIDSSHSVGSTDTSSDSLHWDSSDIGFEPLAVNTDILEQITGLFLECLQAGVTTTSPHSWMTPLRADLPQHPMTPPEVKRKDAFYAQVIANDCGLLQYSHLMNSLESLGHHNYILTWASLMEKITRDRNIVPTQPLPDIIPNLDFTRSQWVSFLHPVASSGSTKNLITIAAQMDNPAVIQDVIFFLQYMVAHQVEMNCSLSRTQLPKLLLQYLTEFSQHRSVIKAYLDSWCLYSELQNDILSALLSVESSSPTQFSCKCGMPLPHRRPVTMENLADIILLHDIVDPRSLAELCQSLGYWKGYCAISLAYCLQPSAQLFPYILQNGNLNVLDYFLEELHSDDFGMVFSTVARINSGDSSTMLCFLCQSQIPFPKQCISSTKEFNHKEMVNGDSHLPENIIIEHHCTKVTTMELDKDDMVAIAESCIEDMKQLWEVVVTKLLYRTSAMNVLRLLSTVQDDIPSGALSERVYTWCILASLAEQRGPAARCALLDSFTGASREPYSHKVFRALHRHPSPQGSGKHVGGSSSPCLSEQVPVTVQNGSSPPPASLVSKESSNPAPLGHHWGVWAEVLEGVCPCCHLRLPTQALVSEGGITVFPCSHAFHTICLSQHGHRCVRCCESHSSTESHNASPSLTTITS